MRNQLVNRERHHQAGRTGVNSGSRLLRFLGRFRGRALRFIPGTFLTGTGLDNLHQSGPCHSPALLERPFFERNNDRFVFIKKCPEVHGLLIASEKGAFRHHGHKDTAGPQDTVGRENVVNVLLPRKRRIHHNARPRGFNSRVFDKFQEINARESCIGLAGQGLLHLPVKLQANQLLHPGLINDICQIAFPAGRLQHDTGGVQFGHLAHLLRNGPRSGKELVLLLEVGDLPGQNHVVQQFGGITVSENVALRFPIPLTANAFQHLVHSLIGAAFKLTIREEKSVALSPAFSENIQNVVGNFAHATYQLLSKQC